MTRNATHRPLARTIRTALLLGAVFALGAGQALAQRGLPEMEPATLSEERVEALNGEADTALARLMEQSEAARTLAADAHGILVCPRVRMGGFIVGAQSGLCTLRVDGESVSYWQTASASLGLQAGVQSFSYALMFMNEDALGGFRSGRSFKMGADASVAVLTRGGKIQADTKNIQQDIVAFAFDTAGAFLGLSLEGSAYERVDVAQAN